MTQSKPARKRSDAIKNEQLILDTAATLFQHHKIENVTMKQIAKAAGVGPGTLYRHFDNKPDICERLIDEQINGMLVAIENYLHANTDKAITERLKQVLTIFLTLKEKNLSLLQEIENAGKKTQSFLKTPIYNDLKDIIIALYQEMEHVKDAYFQTDMLLNAFSSDIYYYERFEQGLSPDEFLNKICDIYVGN